MFLPFDRFPCVYGIPVFIKDGQRCPGKFHACCKVCLFNGNNSRLIFKFRNVFCHLHILALVCCRHFYGFVGRYIACRGFFFPDIILPERQIQSKGCPAVFPGHGFPKQRIRFYGHFPMCQNISFCIQPKGCARYHCAIFRIFFHHCNLHLLPVIFKCGSLFDDWLILSCIGEGNSLCLSIQNKTLRRFCFLHTVCAKREVFNQGFPVFIRYQRFHQCARSILKNPVPVFILLKICGINVLCRIDPEFCSLQVFSFIAEILIIIPV